MASISLEVRRRKATLETASSSSSGLGADRLESGKSKRMKALDWKSQGELSRELPHLLLNTLTKVYDTAELCITSVPIPEKPPEGREYAAHRMEIEGKKIVYRAGKNTPTRPGSFVTLWKRPNKHIEPLDVNSDDFDFLVVDVAEDRRVGQFIFDKDILLKKGIISDSRLGKKGKLSFRVFPVWAKPAKAAMKTQQWQSKYFVEFLESTSANTKNVRRLFKL